MRSVNISLKLHEDPKKSEVSHKQMLLDLMKGIYKDFIYQIDIDVCSISEKYELIAYDISNNSYEVISTSEDFSRLTAMLDKTLLVAHKSLCVIDGDSRYIVDTRFGDDEIEYMAEHDGESKRTVKGKFSIRGK